MISYIEGTVIKIHTDAVDVLTAAGIGFHVFVPRSVFKEITGINKEIYLYTYMQVKEDGMSLYGFFEDNELNTFKKLISVSGVGPKMAMAVLSQMTVTDLHFAVISADIKTITATPGVGKKLAEKIIVELKDDFGRETTNQDFGDEADRGAGVNTDLYNEAAEALGALGYSLSEAMKTVRQVTLTEDTTVEDLIKEALKRL